MSVQGGAKNARVAGGDIRETKVHTGGLFATATTFLTTKAGLATAVVAVVTVTSATIAATTSSGGSSSGPNMTAGTTKDFSSAGVGVVPSGPVTNTLKVTGTTDNGPVDTILTPTIVRCGHTSSGTPGIQVIGDDTGDSDISKWEISWAITPVLPHGAMSGGIRQSFYYIGVPPGFAWNSRYVSFRGVAVSPTDTTTLTITGKLACTSTQ